MLQIRTIVAVAMLATAVTAHADPVNNFKAGASVRIATATVALSEDTPTATSTNKTGTKAAGSLDFTVNASALGLPSNVEITMRGLRRSASKIDFSTDKTFSPALDVGAGIRVSRITGQLPARARWIPGDKTPVPGGNVRLVFDNTSSFVVHTNFGQLRVMLKDTTLIGGITQPALSSFSTTAVVCSDTVVKRYPFTLRLAAPARTTSAPIDIASPLRGVLFPSTILVPKDQQQVTVNARIEANFVGTMRVVAAAGGVKRTLDVVVRRREECVR